MTPYRSRRKRSSFPEQKRTGKRLSGPQKVKRQEKALQNPSRNPPWEPSALQSSDRIRSDRKTDRIRIYSADRRVRCRKEQKADSSADRASVQEEILDYCFFPRSRQEIANRIGKKTSQYIIRRYVMPLVEAGEMAMTLPEKPRSKLQRFYTVR